MKRLILYFFARLLYFLPDVTMLKLQYWIKFHRKLNIKEPKRFTEKMQHYKAFYRNPDMQICTDKYEVRKYVVNKLGTDKYLNKLYQVCDNAHEIDFDNLPLKFVIKTTSGGNGMNVEICRDKSKLDIPWLIKRVNEWNHLKYNILSREWAYEWTSKGDRKSRIIVEEYLENKDNSDSSLDDFKFFCYDGKFRFLNWDKNRYSGHKRRFYDKDLNMLEGVGNFPNFDSSIGLPKNINEMIEVSEKLAAGFPFARVDLYNVDGKIIFGEITFYPASGFGNYHPDSFDFELGKYLNVNNYMCK